MHHLHQVRNLVVADIGDEIVGQSLEQILVISQNTGRGRLFDDGLNDFHLVPAALVVAVGEGVPLPAEGQGFLALQMIPALTEAEASVTITLYIARCSIKCVVRIHINAAQSVHDVDKAPEIDAAIVGSFRSVQIIQHRHSLLHAVKSRMGQLVHLAVKCKRQVVIPRCIYQQDLPTLGIHYRQDVHIAAALSIDIGITLITAAAVDHEGVLGDGAGRLDGCDLMLGDILIEDTGTVRKILVVLLLRQQGDIPLIENDGLHLVIIESICHGRGGFIFRGFYFTHAFLHGRQDLLGVRLVPVGQNAKAVALGITQLCGIVLFHDDDCCHLFFNHDAGNLAQSVLHGACRHSAVDHDSGQHHCQNAADQLAQLIAPQG